MSPVSPVFRPSIFDLVKTASVDKPPKLSSVGPAPPH